MNCARCKQPLPESPDMEAEPYDLAMRLDVPDDEPTEPPSGLDMPAVELAPAGCAVDPVSGLIVHQGCLTIAEFHELDPEEKRVALAGSEDELEDDQPDDA